MPTLGMFSLKAKVVQNSECLFTCWVASRSTKICTAHKAERGLITQSGDTLVKTRHSLDSVMYLSCCP